MSQAAICGIITLVTVVLLFTKIPRGATATLAVLALIITGISSYSDAFKQYSSSTIIIMISMMIVGAALFETGMAMYIGRALTKVTGNKETGIILASMIFAIFISAFVSAAGAYFMFLPIVISITLASGVSFQRTLYAYMVALMIGQYITLVGGTGNLISNNMLIELGFEGWGFFEFLPYAIMIAVTLIPAILFACKKNWLPGRKVVPMMAEGDTNEIPQKMTRKMAVSGIILGAAMILMAMDLDALPMEVIAPIAAILVILTDCVSYRKALTKVDFNTMFMVAGMTALAKAIQSVGLLDALMGKALSGGGNPLMVCAIVYFTSAIGTQFMNNSAWVTVVTPIVVPLAGTLSIPVKALAGMALVGSSSAMLTPMSTSLAGPTMEMAELSLPEFAKAGLITLVASAIAALIWAGVFLL